MQSKKTASRYCRDRKQGKFRSVVYEYDILGCRSRCHCTQRGDLHEAVARPGKTSARVLKFITKLSEAPCSSQDPVQFANPFSQFNPPKRQWITDGPKSEVLSPEEIKFREAIFEHIRIQRRNERLSLPPEFRIALASFAALCTGTISGAMRGVKMSGLRFRAENAHRLPTSQKGWYYYHKSKNYQASLAAFREGPKMGAQLAFWGGRVYDP